MGSSSLLNLSFFSPCFLLEAGSPPRFSFSPGLHPFPSHSFSRPRSRWLDGPIGPRQGRQARRVMTRDYDNRPRMPSSLSASTLALFLSSLFLCHSFLWFSRLTASLKPPLPLLPHASFLTTSLSRPCRSLPMSFRSAGHEAPRAFRTSRPLLLVLREKKRESHASLLDGVPSPL